MLNVCEQTTDAAVTDALRRIEAYEDTFGWHVQTGWNPSLHLLAYIGPRRVRTGRLPTAKEVWAFGSLSAVLDEMAATVDRALTFTADDRVRRERYIGIAVAFECIVIPSPEGRDRQLDDAMLDQLVGHPDRRSQRRVIAALADGRRLGVRRTEGEPVEVLGELGVGSSPVTASLARLATSIATAIEMEREQDSTTTQGERP